MIDLNLHSLQLVKGSFNTVSEANEAERDCVEWGTQVQIHKLIVFKAGQPVRRFGFLAINITKG